MSDRNWISVVTMETFLMYEGHLLKFRWVTGVAGNHLFSPLPDQRALSQFINETGINIWMET